MSRTNTPYPATQRMLDCLEMLEALAELIQLMPLASLDFSQPPEDP